MTKKVYTFDLLQSIINEFCIQDDRSGRGGYSKGTRVSNPDNIMQVYERRIKVNGESANYRLAVDTANDEIVTFFKIGGAE